MLHIPLKMLLTHLTFSGGSFIGTSFRLVKGEERPKGASLDQEKGSAYPFRPENPSPKRRRIQNTLGPSVRDF